MLTTVLVLTHLAFHPMLVVRNLPACDYTRNGQVLMLARSRRLMQCDAAMGSWYRVG